MTKTDERHAVVTGATSGIGRAIALAIAESRASVCIVGRDRDRLEVVTTTARSTARLVLPYRADLTKDSEIENLKELLERDFKGLDTLVHAAGIFTMGSVESTPVEKLDTLYRTNVRAPYALTRALLPLLIRNKGQIVFVNSSQGLQARENCAAYASTHHAMRAITNSLRHEVNAKGVRVLSIFPGRTATPMIEEFYKLNGDTYRPEQLLQPEDVAQTVINALRMPSTAEVTSIELRPRAKSY